MEVLSENSLDAEIPGKISEIIEDEDDEDTLQLFKTRKNKTLILSDDESDREETISSIVTPSLSEDEDDSGFDSKLNGSLPKSRIIKKNNINSDDESEDDNIKSQDNASSSKVKNIYSDKSLFDTQSSDEDERRSISPYPEEEQNELIHKPQKKKSYKENQKALKEIHSETQRMIRESNISIPYHRPKQRTLQDFLNRKRAHQVPLGPKVNLKMSMKNSEVLKALEERKKDVEEFYKSESEDEEDQDDKDWDPSMEKPEESENNLKENGLNSLDSDNENECDELPDLNKTIANVDRLDKSNPEENDSDIMDSIDNNKEVEEQSYESNKIVNECQNNTMETCENSKEEQQENNCNYVSDVQYGLDTTIIEDGIIKDSIVAIDATPDMPKRSFKLNLLKTRAGLDLSQLSKSAPRLSSNKDMIDLDDDLPFSKGPQSEKKAGFYDLLNRFVKHSSAKKTKETKVNMNIVSKEKNKDGKEELVSSTIVIDLDDDEEKDKTDEIPGAKLIKLKNNLRAKMMQQREEDRVRRIQQKQFMDTEEVTGEYNDNYPLIDEEAELTDRSDTDVETESEPEENDVPLIDKKRKKNLFLEDEAEVSENEFDEDSRSTSTKQKENKEDHDEEEEEDTIKLQWDDSDDESSQLPDLRAKDQEDSCKTLERGNSTCSIDSGSEIIGSILPAHQPFGGMKNTRNTSPEPPTSPLTRDNSLISFTAPCDDSFNIPNVSIQLSPSESNSANICSKSPNFKLDFNDVKSTQDNEDELLGLCSGKFSNTDNNDFVLTDTQNMDELAGLCSGKFTSDKDRKIADLLDINSQDDNAESELIGLCSGKFKAPENDISEDKNDNDENSNDFEILSDNENILEQKKIHQEEN